MISCLSLRLKSSLDRSLTFPWFSSTRLSGQKLKRRFTESIYSDCCLHSFAGIKAILSLSHDYYNLFKYWKGSDYTRYLLILLDYWKTAFIWGFHIIFLLLLWPFESFAVSGETQGYLSQLPSFFLLPLLGVKPLPDARTLRLSDFKRC